MIILYTGRRGCGKTLSMVKDAKKFFENGWTIYSNIELNFSHEYMNDDDILKINADSKIDNCVLMIDELQVVLDSRRSMAKKNIEFSHFIQQIRKRNIVLLCTTQFGGTVDLRFRQHVDVEARPNYKKKWHVCEVLYVDVTSINDWDINDERPQVAKVLFNCKQIYGLYDTLNIVRTAKKKKED